MCSKQPDEESNEEKSQMWKGPSAPFAVRGGWKRFHIAKRFPRPGVANVPHCTRPPGCGMVGVAGAVARAQEKTLMTYQDVSRDHVLAWRKANPEATNTPESRKALFLWASPTIGRNRRRNISPSADRWIDRLWRGIDRDVANVPH